MADQQLIRKRAAIKAKLTIFNNYCKPIQEAFNNKVEISEQTLFELQNKINDVECLKAEYEEVQFNIECAVDDTQLDAQYIERETFTNLYSHSISSAQFVIKKLSTISTNHEYGKSAEDNDSNVESHVSNYSQQSFSGIKLPTINLPTFSGQYTTWLEFKDTYESLIHSNPSINNIQKYHYLRASLEGEAKRVIQSLEFSSSSYATAWDLLCNRYNNSRLLVHNHIKSLFELSTITKESSTSLRNLLDNLFKHLRSLQTLQQPIEHWDSLIIFIIVSKLDKTSVNEWEKCKTNNEFPSLSELQQFLKSRADLLEALEINHSNNKSHDTISNVKNVKPNTRRMSLLAIDPKCNLCRETHLIYNCQQFLNLAIKERIDKAKELKLCLNCLCIGHNVRNCRSRGCKHCKKRHNSLLHLEESQLNTQTTLTTQVTSHVQYVLLSTVSVYVMDSSGKKHLCKALLDSASQSNFISSELCTKLKLPQSPTNIEVIGINEMSASLESKCKVQIRSRIEEYSANISCLVVPVIACSLPNQSFDISRWKIPKNIQLADPTFNKISKIELLIGAELFWTIMLNDRMQLDDVVLQSTRLGYILSGSINLPLRKNSYCNFNKFSGNNSELQMDLKQFWELEECKESKLQSKDDQLCESHFQKSTFRNPEGRFVVRLPLKYAPSHLGDSKQLAIKRFLKLENKFKSNPELRKQYTDFMTEYKQLGHMTNITDSRNASISFFLPHHGIFRAESVTTRLRVVFDGSALSTSGWSLNDLQYTGPPIQNDIFDILIRFRQHSFVVTADIEKMYRQIEIDPSDRHLQQIVWRENPSMDLSVFTLNTVTYGTKSAPFLAIRCIKQLAIDNQYEFPVSTSIVNRDFYVDDLITGFDTENDAITKCKEISSILQSASFNLRKWNSNNKTILSHLVGNDDPMKVLSLGDSTPTKTLGLQWDSALDQLLLKPKLSRQSRLSKRTILSDIAKIYDPLGLASPSIILAKVLIQKLWALKVGWDDPVPPDLEHQWMHLRDTLVKLHELRLPRHAICKNARHLQLHGFCDASQKAYGVCIYLRSIDSQNNIHVNLLCAKTKVAPLHVTTIPRLELCSAVLLMRLTKTVVLALGAKFDCFLWSDSQVVLHWLNTDPAHLQIFIGNRVAQIQNTELNCKVKWKYINTKYNPADLASRGVLPGALIISELWWKGPRWLSLSENQWPHSSFSLHPLDEIPELKRHSVKVFTNQEREGCILFPKFSELMKLKRVMAYCLRFISNVKLKGTERQTGQLTVEELNNSMKRLVKLAQQDSFQLEFKSLQSGKLLDNKNRLSSLSPFLDKDGLIRVGGRLSHSNLPFNAKHPLLLDGKHALTKLILHSEHIRLLHAGPQLLLATVRQNYWPIRGMHTTKEIVRKCIKCFRCKPRPFSTIMAALPENRVTLTHPFNVSGVDYAGPVTLRDRKGRGSKTYKGYICLFVCFSTKAVHLELVTELTTDMFITALKRFTCRRGTPSNLYSDNGTNFVGAQKELSKLYEYLRSNSDHISTLCANSGIKWHFIPSNSPHFGGLWESGIKSAKYHLLRVIGTTILTYEEFNTILIQIEGTLNSRPLSPLSSDPNDFTPLTPSHFLIGQPLVTVPEQDVQQVPVNRLTRFQLLQQLHQCFWKRWSVEYLHTLQRRQKWKQGSSSAEIGSLVLIKNDNQPPCKWLLGRVIQVHPGNDQVIRVVTIKTASGTLKRSVTRLCPLPLSKD